MGEREEEAIITEGQAIVLMHHVTRQGCLFLDVDAKVRVMQAVKDSEKMLRDMFVATDRGIGMVKHFNPDDFK
jgi:hypothetical protein